MGREHHTGALVAQVAEQFERGMAGKRIQSSQWLVQHHQLGLMRDSLSNTRALAHAFAEALQSTMGHIGKLHALQGLQPFAACSRSLEARKAQQELHELQRCELFPQCILLGTESQARVQTRIGKRRLAQHFDLPTRGLQLAHQQLQEGRLASAVGA